MSYKRKDNPRPNSDLDDQYSFLLWQKSELQEDVYELRSVIKAKEIAIEDLDRLLKKTYELINKK